VHLSSSRHRLLSLSDTRCKTPRWQCVRWRVGPALIRPAVTKYRIDVDCVVLMAQTRKITLKFDKTQKHTNEFLNAFLLILQVSLPLAFIYGRCKSDKNRPTYRPIKVQIRSDFFSVYFVKYSHIEIVSNKTCRH